MYVANIIVTNLVAFAVRSVIEDLRTRQKKKNNFFQQKINVKALKTTRKELGRSSTKKYAALSLLQNHFVFPHLNYKAYSPNSFMESLTFIEVKCKFAGEEVRKEPGGSGNVRAELKLKEIEK